MKKRWRIGENTIYCLAKQPGLVFHYKRCFVLSLVVLIWLFFQRLKLERNTLRETNEELTLNSSKQPGKMKLLFIPLNISVFCYFFPLCYSPKNLSLLSVIFSVQFFSHFSAWRTKFAYSGKFYGTLGKKGKTKQELSWWRVVRVGRLLSHRRVELEDTEDRGKWKKDVSKWVYLLGHGSNEEVLTCSALFRYPFSGLVLTLGLALLSHLSLIWFTVDLFLKINFDNIF